ncbi:hypothetical protein NBRC10512_000869 [Rhodotorula toruloides]|uniref:Cytochrome c oxidase subunit 8, mitochondrial n=2 Tax=Rhodotorula toruloides TaxID=5286 RepID=A0A061B2E9_RHOTO|nr:cytochrome c oxidase subunit VIIc [Rhodotorula toruloides NP11]EMS24294.1 cytochrome c oxidase subunit VIIc [Rhodotorula toruloides NP11]CDR41844.1 RHTO0S06e07008g1_1 [Rhodotorula toruloides]
MLAHRATTAARASGLVRPLLALRHARQYHVENKVNNNFPFKYEGKSKRRFTVGFLVFCAFGFGTPFLAVRFQQ